MLAPAPSLDRDRTVFRADVLELRVEPELDEEVFAEIGAANDISYRSLRFCNALLDETG